MKWEQRETKISKHYEFLKTSDGVFVGFIIKFDHDFYAWTAHQKIGKFTNAGEAKDAVECLVR